MTLQSEARMMEIPGQIGISGSTGAENSKLQTEVAGCHGRTTATPSDPPDDVKTVMSRVTQTQGQLRDYGQAD